MTMPGPVPPVEPRSVQFLLRNVAIYAIYLAVAVRAEVFMHADAAILRISLLLLAYGGLLFASNWLDARPRAIQAVYLALQAALVLAFFPQNPNLDFLPLLFVPLSLQAVLFFGRRLGFAWIAGFSLLAVAEVLLSWQGQLSSLVTGVLFAASCFFTGNYAHLVRKAEATRQRNRQLLAGLAQAHRRLEEFAAQAEEQAALTERSRMARDLHDSATQTIFSMNLAVQAAQILSVKDPGRMSGQLDRVQDLAHSAVAEIQLLSSQLRQALPAEEDLPAALRRLASERKSRDGLEISLEIAGERTLSAAVCTGLYRIAQEALNNISKHAGTRQAAIRLHLDRKPACLEISDQGAGFKPELLSAGRSPGHHGLSGMAERAREIHWKLTLDSVPGRGTFLRVEELDA